MIKTIKTMSKQEKERYTVPRKVQDVIPVRRIWPDGIFLVGNKFSKTYKFSDINYLVASREDKESMNRSTRSLRGLQRYRPVAASVLPSSSWSVPESLWKPDWKSCKPRDEKTMW